MTKMFSDEDKVLIKCLRESKRYGAKRLLKMFPSGLQKLIRKNDETGSADRCPSTGRPRTACSSTKIEEVEELALSQEGKPHSHSTQRRQIARQTGISVASVNAITRKDLRLKCFKKWQANAAMKRRLPTLSAGTRVSFASNCRKQKPQID